MRAPVPSDPDRFEKLPEWEIHTGSVYLYLVGPGPKAMRRCSRRSVNPGTEAERELAERARQILNDRHRENREAGEAEIYDALVECGYVEDDL